MKDISLSSISTLPPADMSKEEAIEKSEKLVAKLVDIQNRLYAQQKYSVLIVLQGMDTSGKDSAVRKVFSGVNPAGCNVKSFKAPNLEEQAHHFLWRVSKETPRKGMIKIFNRSHYEDILMPMVQKAFSKKEIEARATEINNFEQGLLNNNTIVLKFYLHISHQEQVERLISRKEEPDKRWKYQEEDDLAISQHKIYRQAYEKVFKLTSGVPWNIISSDKKWYKNYLILKEIINELEKYKIHYPKIKEIK